MESKVDSMKHFQTIPFYAIILYLTYSLIFIAVLNLWASSLLDDYLSTVLQTQMMFDFTVILNLT